MSRPARLAVALPGLGRVQRGAEVAFLELARCWAARGVAVDAYGTGDAVPPGVRPRVTGCVPRERFERWPRLPALRSEYEYEELTYSLGLWASRRYRPQRYDAVIGCTYPYMNWFLRHARAAGGRPKYVFVTQNGDWMAREKRREYRFFGCDGLVCTNPEYYDRHRRTYPSALIPNGVDPELFRPAVDDTDRDADPGIPAGAKVVLMAGALIPSKGVPDGVRAAAGVPGAFLLAVGDGPHRDEVRRLAAELLPGRHLLLGSVPRERMPGLYRRASAFLHMSRDEPFGIVYLEAAASGLPVVCHDSPNTRWILGDYALYADCADVPAVTRRLAEALRPEAAELGGRARRRVVADWTWQAQADKYLDFIAGLGPPCSRS